MKVEGNYNVSVQTRLHNASENAETVALNQATAEDMNIGLNDSSSFKSLRWIQSLDLSNVLQRNLVMLPRSLAQDVNLT